MSKSDDLQRMREEQHARRERETKRREEEAKRTPPPAPLAVVAAPLDVVVTAPVALVPVPLDVAAVAPVNRQRALEKKPDQASASTRKKATAATPSAKAKGAAADEETGRCPSCGKVKALNRGLVVDHQKGLGKACPGSRKRPA